MSNADKDQRTLPPTQRRIDEFRRRGEVALGRDLSTVATLVGGVSIASLYSIDASNRLLDFMRQGLGGVGSAPLALVSREAVAAFTSICAPIIVGALVGYAISVAVQIGWPPALRPLGFDPLRPFNTQQLGNILSPKAGMGRVLKATAKVVFVLGAASLSLSRELRTLLADPVPGAPALAVHLGATIAGLVTYGGFALFVSGLLEYLQARRALTAKMRMTPEEYKREHKEQEGDPHVKRRRRQRMRELAQRRLAATVKTADVVLVNPTEYAVALRYRTGEDQAPRVVAKGRAHLAERIRELARQAGVPIVPSPPLCRLIHKLVPEGREIPSALYHAVAEVLAYVYRLRRRAAGAPLASATATPDKGASPPSPTPSTALNNVGVR